MTTQPDTPPELIHTSVGVRLRLLAAVVALAAGLAALIVAIVLVRSSLA